MPTDIAPHAFQRQASRFTLKGWHVLVILMGFFGVVGGVNAVMLRMALTTMPGLDARNGYDVSQRYNSEIEQARAQAGRGMQVDARLARAGAGAELAVDLKDRGDVPPAGLVVTARLEHPALRGRDVALELEPMGSGRYVAALGQIADGGWTLVILVREEKSCAPLFVSRNRVTLGRT